MPTVPMPLRKPLSHVPSVMAVWAAPLMKPIPLSMATPEPILPREFTPIWAPFM